MLRALVTQVLYVASTLGWHGDLTCKSKCHVDAPASKTLPMQAALMIHLLTQTNLQMSGGACSGEAQQQNT